MEVSNETVIPAETAPEAVIEAPAVDTSPVADGSLPVEGQTTTPPVDAYKPDYTYKVVNEVKEFDPRLRGLIKSKEDEQWARDLVTKAEGLEVNKRNLDMASKERDYYKTAYEPLKKEVDQVLQMVDKKDLHSAATVLGFTNQDIINAAYQLVSAEDLPEAHKKAYNERNEYARQQYSLRQQNEEMQTRLQQIETQQRQTELQNIITTNYGDIAKDFDSRNGQDAFWNEVVSRGLMYAKVHNQVRTPQDIIGEMINVYGLKREPQTAKQAAVSGQGPLPVIPNTGTSGAAPVMKKPKTLAELQKYAKTLQD